MLPPLPQGSPRFQHGHTQAQALQSVEGEVFALRKLLPHTADYDFNIHVMDFLPGQHLSVKEVHYNQHGLLLLTGKGKSAPPAGGWCHAAQHMCGLRPPPTTESATAPHPVPCRHLPAGVGLVPRAVG